MAFEIGILGRDDVALVRQLSGVFGEAFDDPGTYTGKPPSDGYLERLLGSDNFICLVALDGDKVVAGIAAYELPKLEQERSEVYLYDLAVLESHRRQGIATALIENLRDEARRRGAWVVYVQADTGEEDAPAIALYTRLGNREDVLHFDIEV